MQKEKKSESLKVNISVENFGPIEKADIDLRPLTIFVGESNTGKTYLATLIYTLHQYFKDFRYVPWTYNSVAQIKFENRLRDPSEENQFKLEEDIADLLNILNTQNRSPKFKDLPSSISFLLLTKLKESKDIEGQIQRCFNLESLSELIRITNKTFNELRVSLKVNLNNTNLWSFCMHDNGSLPNTDGTVNEDLILSTYNTDIFQQVFTHEDLQRILHISDNKLGISYYLPADRSGIMNNISLITNSLIERGTRGGLDTSADIPMITGKTADFLRLINNFKKQDKSPSEIIQISKVLENDILNGNIEIKRLGDVGLPQFYYRPKNREQEMWMNRSSSMVSELAPLVLYLRSIVKPGDTLIIEEPESHLHPRAQTQIAIVLAKLVRAGVRVIITTHSEWLLEQIGNLVREGEVKKTGKNHNEPKTWLTTEEVGAWRFFCHQPVEEIKFDPINGFEPIDYGEVAEKLYNQSVDLRTLLMEKTGDNTSDE